MEKKFSWESFSSGALMSLPIAALLLLAMFAILYHHEHKLYTNKYGVPEAHIFVMGGRVGVSVPDNAFSVAGCCVEGSEAICTLSSQMFYPHKPK